ncbi:homoserine kinase [Tamaricihabitans halophyticus]|uniref:Homoserine kinase n=1 Tax=Tamaricihabitans halophyticus TaxID=1262583 RepID=A0A4R2QZJ0_9PSEU|nr:homoserine kinase [Tamaricihabitans halophyticus]TCP54804.1 homoserine kinase [Tamaricihabitans halophyticus]
MSAPEAPGLRITVPASTANLGSGFDALGMALGMYDVVEVRASDGRSRVEVAGQGTRELPSGERHLVLRALRAASNHLGHDAGALRVFCQNAIPHSRGLGSSAAAIVAGITAGYALAGAELDEGALNLAADFEGHADNAAASLYGGLVLVWRSEHGFHASRAEPHGLLRPVVAIPEVRSATAATRGLLPETVPHADAAFAAGRAALVVHAVTTRPELLLAATDDRLHQGYRRPAWPASMALIEALRERGVAAAISGAGPTVLALTTDGVLPEDVDTTGFEVRELSVDLQGVSVDQLS